MFTRKVSSLHNKTYSTTYEKQLILSHSLHLLGLSDQFLSVCQWDMPKIFLKILCNINEVCLSISIIIYIVILCLQWQLESLLLACSDVKKYRSIMSWVFIGESVTCNQGHSETVSRVSGKPLFKNKTEGIQSHKYWIYKQWQDWSSDLNNYNWYFWPCWSYN